jgi:hypothetical protein
MSESMRKPDPQTRPWRPPTRRAFVQMLAAAAAAVALKDTVREAEVPLWIGHF